MAPGQKRLSFLHADLAKWSGKVTGGSEERCQFDSAWALLALKSSGLWVSTVL